MTFSKKNSQMPSAYKLIHMCMEAFSGSLILSLFKSISLEVRWSHNEWRGQILHRNTWGKSLILKTIWTEKLSSSSFVGSCLFKSWSPGLVGATIGEGGQFFVIWIKGIIFKIFSKTIWPEKLKPKMIHPQIM